MTSVLTPVLSESTPPQISGGSEKGNAAFQKQDTREYLADMLRELSAIAAWAELHRTQEHIDAALHEVETKDDRQ